MLKLCQSGLGKMFSATVLYKPKVNNIEFQWIKPNHIVDSFLKTFIKQSF